jgi:excisionase family DNA binding protein
LWQFRKDQLLYKQHKPNIRFEKMMNKTNGTPPPDKQVFTTGEAAKICNVSQQTIIRCFDSGRLQGFKVPGSRFRRIPRAELQRFMQQNNMDQSRLGTSIIQVLVIGLNSIETDSVIRNHAVGHNLKIHHASNAWEAGFLAHKFKPELVFMGSSVPGLQEQMVQNTLSSPEGVDPMIVVVKNTHQDLNVPSKYDESSETIKKAVLQLLST